MFEFVKGQEISEEVTEETVYTGTDLYCYECKENYKAEYDPMNSPCRNNVTTVGVRRCLAEHRYCQVLVY